MSLESLLNTTITLQRKSTAVDASLGTGDTWTTVVSVSASIQPISAKEKYSLAQRGVWMTHRIYLATDIEATPRDRILTSDNKTFNILAYYNQAGRNRVYMIDAKEQT